MDLSVFKEWLPIILAGAGAAIVIMVLARFITKVVFYIITSVLSLICIFTFLYSIFGVGGWAGMGLGVFTVSIYLGIIVGTILSVLVKKK